MRALFVILLAFLSENVFADVCFKLTVVNNSGKTVRVKSVFGDNRYSEVTPSVKYFRGGKDEVNIRNNEIVDFLVESFTPKEDPESKDRLVFSLDERETEVIINPSFLGSDFIYIENEKNGLNVSKEVRLYGVGYDLVIPKTSSLTESCSVQNEGRCVSLVQRVFDFYKKIMG